MDNAGPRLRSDLSIVSQVYRGEESFVVKDAVAQRYFRFGAVEMRVMRYFDGSRSVAEIASALTDDGVRVSMRAIEDFARNLDEAGFLQQTIERRAVLQLERLRGERAHRRAGRFLRGDVLRLRWSRGDPDRVLSRLLPALRWCFTPGFLAVSALLFGTYLVILGQNWDRFWTELAAAFLPANITLGGVAVLWLTGAVVILVHELGHAFTCKQFGGEVREIGFMLLYFQPAFYCNVSDAWTFPDLRARLWVTAAGSWVQMVLASVAAVLWILTTPASLLANVSLAVMIMGGVTTLVTNMNPLLPLDGYFALSDWLAIPNLRRRALHHYRWWIKRRCFGLDLPEPAATARERRIFLTYGVLAGAYVALLFGLLGALTLGWASRALGPLGVVIGATVVVMLLHGWLGEWSRTATLALRAYRARNRRHRRWRRHEVIWITAGALVLVGVLPWKITTAGPFVVQPLVRRAITAAADGVVGSVTVTEGMVVLAGSPVARLVDRTLEHELITQTREADSLALDDARLRADGRSGEEQQRAADRESARARLAALKTRWEQLTLRAGITGVLPDPRPERLVGRRVRAGDNLFTISAIDSFELRVALSRAGATAVRPGQIVRLFTYAEDGRPLAAVVDDVSVIGRSTGRPGGVVEARVHVAAGGPWRLGATGEASIELRRSNVFGALWWRARQLVRTDLWL